MTNSYVKITTPGHFSEKRVFLGAASKIDRYITKRFTKGSECISQVSIIFA